MVKYDNDWIMERKVEVKIKIISRVSITCIELEELLVRMIKEIDSGLRRFR